MLRFVHRPVVLSVLVMVLLGFGIKHLLGDWVLPRMLARGNESMVASIVEPLESYFVDYQAWPSGPAEETMRRLQGAKNDVMGEGAPEGPPGPLSSETTAPGAGGTGAADAPSVRRVRLLPTVNYLRYASVRPAGLALGDAWGRPFEFSFVPDGPSTITSMGADGVLGTADDVSATARIGPRITHPTRALFVADREFQRAEEAKRFELARKLAERRK